MLAHSYGGGFVVTFIFLVGLFSHKLRNIFPKNVPSALCESQVHCKNQVLRQVFVVCPRDTCNALYKQRDGVRQCIHIFFGKCCGTSLGYYTNLAHGKRRWKPYKVFQFIPPSASLKNMFTSDQFKLLLDRRRSRYIIS